MMFPVAGLKLFWERVTFSRITMIYFVFSVVHCIIQVVFQVQAFVANANAATYLHDLINQGNALDDGFTVFGADLRVCERVPTSVDPSSCDVIWDGRGKVKYDSANNAVSIVGAAASSPAAVAVAASTTTVTTVSSVTANATSTTSSRNATVTAPPNRNVSNNSTGTSSSRTSTVTVTLRIADAAATPKSKIALEEEEEEEEEEESESEDSDDSDSVSSVSEDEEEEDKAAKAARRAEKRALQAEKADSIKRWVRGGAVTFDKRWTRGGAITWDKRWTRGGAITWDKRYTKGGAVKFNKRDDEVSPIIANLQGVTPVDLHGLHGINTVELPRKCLYALNWPVEVVHNTKREDIAFISFQFWVLGVSLVALLNESIPHIIASLSTHLLATAWGAYQIFHTQAFRRDFNRLTTEGACGINLLPNYWKSRGNAEIPSLALNIFAMVLSIFLTWRLVKAFGWQTFKRVGASRTINRVYNTVLFLSITIQLALFFVGASAALWIDQVYHGDIARHTQRSTFFKAVMITVLVLLIPWLTTGWLAVRKEARIPMLFFLVTAGLLLLGWASMFIAPTFRWTFVTWRFFSLMATVAVTLTLTTLVVGIICRVNFGKGLTHYLNAQQELPEDDITPYSYTEKVDPEKADFPSMDAPLPTYASVYGSSNASTSPSNRFVPRLQGPRFTGSSPATSPTNTNVSPTDTLRSIPATLQRHDSQSSQKSSSSQTSSASHSSQNSRRWVIE